MSIHRLEELSTPQLDALDRARTVVILTVSPLETHGPHLPLGVDAFTARHFTESIAERLVVGRPGWTVVLAPTLHLGSFTFDTVGTVAVRQRVVRDAVVDYGSALGRAGFRHVLVSNGHGGPGHLVALEEAAAIVSRRHGITMASFTGHLAWEFMRGRLLPRIEAALGRPLSAEEREAFSEDAHGGWWETSIMLVLRPDLVDDGYRQLPAARYSLAERLRPNYAVRNGGPGYVGHPAMADPAFARVTTRVLIEEAMAVVDGLLDGRLRPSQRRSPFFSIPFFRTDFRRAAAATAVVLAALAAWWILG
ncbi:MAG: creatininase family protein, partial [Candidatus Rokuibacteriota bacterium]